MATIRSRARSDRRRGSVTRRAILGGIGGALVLGSASGAAAQTGDGGTPAYAVEQGDRCVPIAPLSGEETVEALYGLRVPERYGGENGSTDPGSGPYHQSTGTTELQQPNATITFLYDGPGGLSLVVVHGDAERGNGGSATWEVEGLPPDGAWVVRDDYYLDPQSGEVDPTNYDRWDLAGEPHVIDWTWDHGRTDGGAFRGLGSDFEVTVTPAYNDAATLWEEHYYGRVTDWQVLSGSRGDPASHAISLDEPVTIRTDGCSDRRR